MIRMDGDANLNIPTSRCCMCWESVDQWVWISRTHMACATCSIWIQSMPGTVTEIIDKYLYSNYVDIMPGLEFLRKAG